MSSGTVMDSRVHAALKNIAEQSVSEDSGIYPLVAAYKDFGRLKVAPAGGVAYNSINVRSSATAVWPSHILWGGLTAFKRVVFCEPSTARAFRFRQD